MSQKDDDWKWGGVPPFGKGKGGAESMLEHIMQDPMAFLQDPNDPRPEHEGKFIDEEDLLVWWKYMQQKYPQNYRVDDKLFGDDGAQHRFGTKLMSFFDDDPNQPIRLQVRGSRWVDEGFGHLTPMYIVRHKGSSETSQIELGSGHEEGGWRVGWDDGEEDIVPYEGQEENDKDVEEDNKTGEELVQWFQQTDGPIDNAFLIHTSFTAEELASLESGNGVLSNLSRQKSTYNSSVAFEVRAIIMKIILAWTQDYAGAVILKNEIGTKFQAIEFNSPMKCSEGIPRIQISYAISPQMDLAEGFLRGEEIKVIECSDQAAVAVEQHIISNCVGEELNDIGSGLLLYEGYLVPLSSQRSESPAIPVEGIADGNFGIELELSCAVGTPLELMTELLKNVSELSIRGTGTQAKGLNLFGSKSPVSSRKGDNAVQYAGSKKPSSKPRGAGNTVNKWKLVNDRSIRASSDLPSSSKFELVSPVLRGKAGLDECRTMLKALSDVSAVQVNKSMGFHVHIDVEWLSLEGLIILCQNFIIYERVIDSFMPPSRRTGSDESDRYFKSNRSAILGERGSIEQGCAKLAACETENELYNVMNPDGRYYKLNLQNLKKGRQPTVEFRQHSGTSNFQKVAAWVRFCMALVHNSASKSAGQLKQSMGQTDCCFDNLFDVLIQDRTLKEFYSKRREELG